MTRRAAKDDFEPDYDLMRELALEPDDDELVDPDDDELEPDDELVLRLLRGTTRKDSKSPLVRYLTAGEERESRKALAVLLRSGMSVQIPNNSREQLFNKACFWLADLLDPDVADSRKIVFAKPKGAIAQDDRNKPVVREVWEFYTRHRLSVEEAVARAAAKHSLSESTVYKLWYGKPGAIWRKFIAIDLPL
jgi:hypothetical protein